MKKTGSTKGIQNRHKRNVKRLFIPLKLHFHDRGLVMNLKPWVLWHFAIELNRFLQIFSSNHWYYQKGVGASIHNFRVHPLTLTLKDPPTSQTTAVSTVNIMTWLYSDSLMNSSQVHFFTYIFTYVEGDA